MKRKSSVAACFNSFLADNRFKSNHQYKRLLKPIYTVLLNASTYRISVRYRSPAGRINLTKEIPLSQHDIDRFETDKLTASTFAKEQRMLMTNKLREFIKKRDNFTCCNCGNSVYNEPNLLLEIDHIIPIAKGGCTAENNLQTLCWKCNRAKSDKINSQQQS